MGWESGCGCRRGLPVAGYRDRLTGTIPARLGRVDAHSGMGGTLLALFCGCRGDHCG